MKEAKRVRDEQRRREKGVRSRAEYRAECASTLEPWKHLGISRRTFYRKPKAERESRVEALRAEARA